MIYNLTHKDRLFVIQADILLDFCFELNSVVTAAKESADHENMIWTEPHLYMWLYNNKLRSTEPVINIHKCWLSNTHQKPPLQKCHC